MPNRRGSVISLPAAIDVVLWYSVIRVLPFIHVVYDDEDNDIDDGA